MRRNLSVILAIVLLAAAGCSTQRFLDPASIVEMYEKAGLPVTPSQDSTESKCTNAFPCKQAISTRSVVVYKFNSRDRADAAGKVLGDKGYVSNWIVLEFVDPNLTEEQKTWMKQGPDDSNTW